MGFWKNLFNFKRVEVESDDGTILTKEDTLKYESVDEFMEKPKSTEVRGHCKICSQDIFMDDKYTKQVGDYYHRKCWKDIKKKAWGS